MIESFHSNTGTKITMKYIQDGLQEEGTRALIHSEKEYELLLKRFRHLLESDFISKYDEVEPRTGEYKLDIKELDKINMKNIVRQDGLTEDEGKVMDSLITAFNEFCKLGRQHPDEIRDFTDGIHKCQDLLAVRIARREYPNGWPIK